jgi:hypothetical protein
VNGAIYRRKKVAGWVVGPLIRGKGNKAVSRRKHPSTRALSLCGPVDLWEGNASVTRRKQNHSAYDSHGNETHVTDKTHSNAVRLKFLRIQTEDPS